VIEASDGASALDTGVSEDKHLDVLLTDVVMRGISGPELVRQLASSRPKTKVIFMSGYTGELLSEHDVFQAGTRFLEKPFSRASLLKLVDAALEEAE
jgi:two-component system cell cycle sensor histidine kinase/response regulator CckA